MFRKQDRPDIISTLKSRWNPKKRFEKKNTFEKFDKNVKYRNTISIDLDAKLLFLIACLWKDNLI